MEDWKGQCHRCGNFSSSHGMSFFNVDLLCGDCLDKEEAHPKFAEAKETELAAVMRGDYNFPGIGKPADL